MSTDTSSDQDRATQAAARDVPARVRGPLRRGVSRALGQDESGVLAVLVTLVVVVSLFHGDFLEVASISGTLRQTAFIAIMAFGMVFLVTMRDFDLSVGGNYGFCVMLAASVMAEGVQPWLAAALAVVAGVGLGVVNGLIAEGLRVPVIIVTLGTLSMYRGLAELVTGGEPVSGLPLESSFFTTLGRDVGFLPAAAIVMALLCAALTLVYRRTRFGAQVRAIGSNPAAARLAGVRISAVRIATLALIGAMVGVAAVLTLAYFGTADPTQGSGYELYVIAAVVIGATPLSGGRGTVIGALLGAMIIQVIQSGLVFFGVGAQWSTFATGAVIVAAVAFDNILRRRSEQRQA